MEVIMATFQLRLDDTLKQKADTLFSSLGLAISDSRNKENLHGPFKSAQEAVASMLED